MFYLMLTVPVWALNAPSNLTAKAVSDSQIRLTWSDKSSQESGFSVYRSTDGGTSFAKVIDLPANSVTYTDAGLSPATSYTYRVDAFVAPASSKLTQSSTGGTEVAPPPPPPSTEYPDATNTGVQTGVTLKRIPEDVTSGPGWYWDSRGWVVINVDGTVFSGFIVPDGIDVLANNVVIDNVKIFNDGMWAIAVRHARNTTIRNCEIGGLGPSQRMMVGIKNIYGDEGDTIVQKCEITNTSTGIQIDRGLIEDNYIHDMAMQSGEHVNGITSNASTGPLVIRHNTVFNQITQTDAISLFEDFGVQKDRLIENNLIAGGGYTIYAGQNAGGPAAYNIVVRNNRVSKRFFTKGGYWGPATAYNSTGSGNVWTGNVWDDTGAEVPAP